MSSRIISNLDETNEQSLSRFLIVSRIAELFVIKRIGIEPSCAD